MNLLPRQPGPQPWIAYVGPFRYPWGEPNSRRVDGVARSLAAAGRHVVVASGEAEPSSPAPLVDTIGSGSIQHVGLDEAHRAAGGPSTYAKVFLRWGLRTRRWLSAQPTRPSHVLVHGGLVQYMAYLQPWCRRNYVTLIADVVDWPNGRYVRGGPFGPLNVSMKLALHHHYARCDGVIAISTLLEEHYRERGLATVRIPPTLDAASVLIRQRHPDRELTLAYAGNPCGGRKDLLSAVVEATERVAAEGLPVRLHIYGPTPAEVVRMLGREPSPAIRCLGLLPHPEVLHVVQEADFSVLLRRPERSTNAGFSTKLCESLAAGTPVIANITSDIGLYVHDGQEGLVCPDASVDGLVRTIRRAVLLDAAVRARMRGSARRRALESFDFRVYAGALNEFLDAAGSRLARRATNAEPTYNPNNVSIPIVEADETAS